MLTIIFGAGASYDSDPTRQLPSGYEDRPPLAKELFDIRFASVAARYRRIAAIANDIRRRIDSGENIETVLANLQLTSSKYPLVPSQMMSVRYYLRDLIDESTTRWSVQCGGATTYAEFVNRLNAWSHETNKPVNYITFNYDVLLEDALLNLGQRFDELEDYIKPPAIGSPNVIRPHGCVRWYQVMSSSTPLTISSSPLEVIPIAGKLTPTNEFTIGQPDSHFFDSLGKLKTAVPALAIPMDNKQDYVCPERHVNTMREILQSTKVLLVIGWRGSDPNLLSELQSLIAPKTDLLVCNGTVEESAETIRAMGLSKAQMRPPQGIGFSDLPHSNYLKEILRLPALVT